MFNQKSKSDNQVDAPVPSGGTSLIASGTTLKGDITSNGDIRIDGTLHGNIQSTAKIVIGANGIVNGDISGQQADIMGRITGTVKVKELLQLKGGSVVNGNLHAAKLQIEPSANFNGQCHMNENVLASNSVNGNGSVNGKKEREATVLMSGDLEV